MRFSRSAQPKPSSHRISPLRATATATDGIDSAVIRSSMSFRVVEKSGLAIRVAVGCDWDMSGETINSTETTNKRPGRAKKDASSTTFSIIIFFDRQANTYLAY